MPDQLIPRASTRVDHVGRSGVYPMSGPWPSGDAPVVGQGELAHPEERQRPRAVTDTHTNATLLACGRAIFGGFFLYNGINHFRNRQMMSDYARSKGVAAPEAAVLGTGAILVAGGISLITGVRPKLGASLIASFLAGVSPKMHDFWAIDDPQEKTQELVNFTKNMALIGGACFAAALPEPWPASLESGRYAI